MNERELKKLWDKLQGKINVGSFESFKSKMSTPEQRKRFFDKYYQKLKDEYNFTLGEFADFERRLTASVNPQPSPSQTNWDNFPCVSQLATQKGVSQNSNGSYTIDGFIYYSNGRKMQVSTQQKSNYSCDDNTFNTNSNNQTNTQTNTQRTRRNDGIYYQLCPETLPIRRYCKNETIRKIQNCIGVTPDSKFGPITQEALEALDLPGTRITADSLAKACSRQMQSSIQTTTTTQIPTQTTTNTQTTNTRISTTDRKNVSYYDDYKTVETEVGDESSKPSTNYDDYSAIEGDETTPQTTTQPTPQRIPQIRKKLTDMSNVELAFTKQNTPLMFKNLYDKLGPIEKKIVDDKLSGETK